MNFKGLNPRNLEQCWQYVKRTYIYFWIKPILICLYVSLLKKLNFCLFNRSLHKYIIFSFFKEESGLYIIRNKANIILFNSVEYKNSEFY
jgi:hypothetical protein